MNRRPSFVSAAPPTHSTITAACDWLEIDRGRAVRYQQLVAEFFEEDARSQQHFLAIGDSCDIVRLFELWEIRVSNFQGSLNDQRSGRKGTGAARGGNPDTSSYRARDDVFSYLVAGTLLSASVLVLAVDGILLA